MNTTKHDAQRFNQYADEAAKYTQLARQADASADNLLACQHRRSAETARQIATGFDPRDAAKAFSRTALRVNLGLSQGALDALDRLGHNQPKHLNPFLSRLVEEAIFALEEANIKRPPTDYSLSTSHCDGRAGHYLLRAEKSTLGNDCYCRAHATNITTQAALEFELARAMFTQPSDSEAKP